MLNHHIEKRRKEGIVFSKICYIGDGKHDICPILLLSAEDYIFMRAKYSLEKKVKEKSSVIKANAVSWKTAKSILEVIRDLLRK